MSFNNRFTFLKHKYFHINIISSSSSSLSVNNNKISKRKNNPDEPNEEEDEVIDQHNENSTSDDVSSEANLYDLNTLYKRSLLNRDTLTTHGSLSANSQMAICSAKAKSIANGSNNSKEEEKATLAKLIRQNSLCDICHKCISEKKKLIAHRKLCLVKFNKKTNDESKKHGEAISVHSNLNILTEKNQVTSLNENSNSNSNLDIEKIIKKKKRKIKKTDNSIDLNYLFE